jgi:hypothetical protein
MSRFGGSATRVAVLRFDNGSTFRGDGFGIWHCQREAFGAPSSDFAPHGHSGTVELVSNEPGAPAAFPAVPKESDLGRLPVPELARIAIELARGFQ